MTIKLVPKYIKNLIELRKWFDENILDTDTVVGIRKECKITKIKEFNDERWTTYGGVSIYYNF